MYRSCYRSNVSIATAVTLAASAGVVSGATAVTLVAAAVAGTVSSSSKEEQRKCNGKSTRAAVGIEY
jgi:hypothetical protein